MPAAPSPEDPYWGLTNGATGESLLLSNPPLAADDSLEDVCDLLNSVRRYFRELEAHLQLCPENYGPFVSDDCLMIRPYGGYMTNSGGTGRASKGGLSREEMCRTFLTWLAPQKILSLENVRFLGGGGHSCTAQIRMFQHFTFGDVNTDKDKTASVEEDVALFTFVLERYNSPASVSVDSDVGTTSEGAGGQQAPVEQEGDPGDSLMGNTSGWRAVLLQRAVGAPPAGAASGARSYTMELQPAPNCDAGIARMKVKVKSVMSVVVSKGQTSSTPRLNRLPL
eukprot:g15711.t1